MYKIRMRHPLRISTLATSTGPQTHWHHQDFARPYWRLYYNREPGWHMEYRGQVIPMMPEVIHMIAPETVYQGTGPSPVRHVFAHFTIDGLGHWIEPGVWTWPLDPVIDGMLQAIGTPRWELQVQALALTLISRIDVPSQSSQLYSPPITAVLALLEDSLTERVTLDEMARHADMHPHAFVRRFHAELGMPPQAWHRQRRIAATCVDLDRSDESIDAIAERYGFCDRHHFSKVFSKVRGHGPGAYRNIFVNDV